MEPIGCPEKSVRHYGYLLFNSPEERISLAKGLLPVPLTPTYEISWRYAGTLRHRHLIVGIPGQNACSGVLVIQNFFISL